MVCKRQLAQCKARLPAYLGCGASSGSPRFTASKRPHKSPLPSAHLARTSVTLANSAAHGPCVPAPNANRPALAHSAREPSSTSASEVGNAATRKGENDTDQGPAAAAAIGTRRESSAHAHPAEKPAATGNMHEPFLCAQQSHQGSAFPFHRRLHPMLGRIKAASKVPPLAGVVDGEVLKSVEPQAAAGGVSSGGTGIAALPESVARTVRCGVLAPNIGAHLLQLMYNALDAKAANVAIKICLRSFTLQVRDDGEGMTFEDLRLCGERSFTSKLRHLSQLRETAFSTYGYRGESLAAISEFCHLEILSRSRARPAETCRKVMLSDEKATLARVLDSAGIGTTVTCRNLFFNRPVARKALQQRAGTFEASMAGQLQALLRLVRALAAIHPDVSFTVYDGTRIQPILALPKCAGVRQAFARISRAVSPNDLFHVGLSYGSYQIKALLCPPTQANLPRTKDAQLIYVNGRLCTRCPVHKRMNRAYKDVLERTTTSPDLSAATAAKGTERAGQVAFPQRKRRRGEDGPSILAPMKRCPVFLVRISCPPSDCAISEPLEPGEGASVEFASWDEVLVAVDALCAEFFSSLELRQDNILAVAGNGETARMLDEGRGGGLDQDVTVQARGKDAQAGGVFADCAAPLQHNMDCTGAIVAQVEEETLDSEEMRIIELAMQSATSAARLATTQGDLNPQLTCQVNDPMARGPRMALAACSTTSASSHGLQAHQDVPQRRWFNPEKQQWQLVSVSPSRQRSKLGGKRGVNSSATRFLAAAARKRERERGRERERNSAIELELAAQGRDRPSRVCGEACDGDQTQNFGDARNVISHQVHLEDNAGESGHAAEDAARGVAADCCSSCTPGASDALSRLLREGGKRDRRQENHYAPLVESLSSDRKMQEGDERDYLIAVTTGRNKGASATWQETEGLLDVHVEGRSARKGESEGNGCAKWDQVQEETFRGGDCDSDAGLKGLMNIGAMLEAWDNPVVGAYGCATSHRILR